MKISNTLIPAIFALILAPIVCLIFFRLIYCFETIHEKKSVYQYFKRISWCKTYQKEHGLPLISYVILEQSKLDLEEKYRIDVAQEQEKAIVCYLIDECIKDLTEQYFYRNLSPNKYTKKLKENEFFIYQFAHWLHYTDDFFTLQSNFTRKELYNINDKSKKQCYISKFSDDFELICLKLEYICILAMKRKNKPFFASWAYDVIKEEIDKKISKASA